MEKLFNWISIVLGLIGGIICKQLGGWDMLLKTIVFFVVLDYVTGWIKAIHEEKLSSEVGFKGILKKVVVFIVIAVAYKTQELIGNAIPIREIVIMFYLVNEALSLLENAAIFIPIPQKLKDILLQLREKDDTEGE